MNYNNSDILQDIHNYGISFSSREIFLHNFYGSEESNPGVEYRMANTFIKNITTLNRKSSDDILVHMHSIGGEWSDGIAIFDAISMSKSKVSIIVYGQAESMSGVILQSADQRIMTKNSYFMLHYGSSGIGGEYNNVHNWMKFEEQICNTMFDIYSKRCYKGIFFKEKYGGRKESIPKVKNWLKRKLKDGDWYMSSEDCIYYGFADSII
jgi:ATP-dependent protease ClpP protease subunit